MGLMIGGVSKRFGAHTALADVSLRVEPGAFLAVLGPSGSGKTTLLRVLAGLERPDSGQVRFDGEDLLALPARARRVGMVFQHYALFTHMTVAKNIAFGLSVRPGGSPAREAIAATVERLLGLVQLEGLGGRYPSELSGGQQQRVALARALAIEPRLLLLDEPFGALDAKVRKGLRQWLRSVHTETGVTTLFVTHDQDEAMDLADHVAILRDGRIEQVGSPQMLDEHPASAFVFDFLGDANRRPCTVDGALAMLDGYAAPAVTANGLAGPATAWFRPHETTLEPTGEGLAVTITAIALKGATVRIECRDPDGRLYDADRPRGSPLTSLAVGSAAKLKAARVVAFPESDTGVG
ncbi:MAG TPA: sulfate/molybdate ABC transporter ATP-binding protein [Caulobacteraceae bacterium]|nr:sulfate/molybdate ABC transporter ATP-binding protein [Caulobacteraceae bacterium]